MSHPVWQDILNTLEPTMSRPNFVTWLKSTDLTEDSTGVMTITVPNQYAKTWLESNLVGDIESLLKKHFNPVGQVRIVVSKQPSASLENLPILRGQEGIETEALEPRPPRIAGQFSPKYSFSTFVVGNNNRLAFAAAQAVADKPGEAYNPLFIYGGVGLGKTHLMQAIGNQIIASAPRKKIAYLSCETFASEFVESLQNRAINEFKRKYRGVDVLLVDDIQFLANKEGTQEEFFHTFNALHQSNRQIVLTADRMPKEIGDLEERLVSRIGWGMVADIQTPNFETRLAILRAKAAQMGLEIEVAVLEHIANAITNNIRELEASLTRLSSSARVENRPITVLLAKAVLKDLSRLQNKNLTTKKIIQAVCHHFDVETADILGRKRTQSLVYPRQVVMYLLRSLLSQSFPQIGEALGGKDHTTIMHGAGKIERLIKSDSVVEQDVREITRSLEAEI